MFDMKVDYTQYYINGKLNRKKPEKKRRVAPDTQPKATANTGVDKDNRCGENLKEKQHKKHSSQAFIIVLIILCFLLTFAFASLFSTGSVIGVFSSGNEMGYYAVYKKIEGDYSAVEQHSLLVRSGGGGGNIIKVDGEYAVVYAVYLDKGSAQNVASREEGLKVRSVVASSIEGDAEYVKMYDDLKAGVLKDLYDTILSYSKNSDDAELSLTVRNVSSTCTDFKHIVEDDNTLEKSEKLSIIVATDTINGKIESILYAEKGAEKLANMWYQMYSIVVD